MVDGRVVVNPKRCPFCGYGSDLYDATTTNAYWVRCFHCGALGPVCKTRGWAIRKWNESVVGVITPCPDCQRHRVPLHKLADLVEAGA